MTVVQPNSISGITSLSCTGDSLSIHDSGGNLVRTLITGGGDVVSGVLTVAQIGSATDTLTIPGNLTVQGTRTILNTDELNINDKLVGIASTATPTSLSQDNAGIIIYGKHNVDFKYEVKKAAVGLNTALCVAGFVTSFGGLNAAGGLNVGTAATISTNGNATFSGIVTAASFVGDGSGLTGAGAALTGSTNNTIVTVTGADAMQGEANLTFVSGQLDVINTANLGDAKVVVTAGEAGGASLELQSDEADDNADGWRIQNAGDSLLGFRTKDSGSWVQKMKIGNDGDVTIDDGNLVIGTSGKGIDFSATSNSAGTMSSELLDDYEEGTFTGTWTAYTSGCSTTQTSANFYTKIGRQVTCWINASNMSLVGGSGAIKMEGLPFATSSSLGGGATGTAPLTYKVGFDTDMHYTFYTWNSVSFFIGYRSRNGTTWQAWDITEWDTAGSYCQMTFTYFTDS